MKDKELRCRVHAIETTLAGTTIQECPDCKHETIMKADRTYHVFRPATIEYACLTCGGTFVWAVCRLCKEKER